MPLRKTKKVDGGYHSFDNGVTCVASAFDEGDEAPRYFASRRTDSPHYDPTLAGLTRDLHSLLGQAHVARKDKRTRIGLLVTSHGLLPVWKFEYTDAELPEGVDDGRGILLDEKSDAEVAALLGLDTSTSADAPLSVIDKKRIFRKAEPTGDGGVDCIEAGKTCMIEPVPPSATGAPRYFAYQRKDAADYDATLGELSGQLNAMVEKAHLARKDSDARIGLVLTHRGLLPVWKRPQAGTRERLSERSLEDMSDDEVTALLHLA